MAGGKSDGLLGGMIIGAAIGAIAGVLAAPRTGKDTRRILKKSADALPELAEDLATSLQFQADRLSENSLSNWEQTLSRLREAVVAGRAAGRQEWARQADIQTGDQIVGIANTPSAHETAHDPIDEVSNGLRSPKQTSSQSAALEE
ncbi:MAG: YtxH domain-containing protein [Cyanobacteria bacterium P01_D01_bin.1]